MDDEYVLDRFSVDSDPTIWIYQPERYFNFYGFSKDVWLSLPYLYFDGEALSWFNWLYRNKQFCDWTNFTEKLACQYRRRIVTELKLSPIIDLLLQMDENLSRMGGHLNNIRNNLFACSREFADAQARSNLTTSLVGECEIKEGTEPNIVSALNEDNSNPIKNLKVMFELPFDVEHEKLDHMDTYLSVGCLEPLPIPTEIVVGYDFATEAIDGVTTYLKGGEHHMFDEFPQKKGLIYRQVAVLHIQLDPSLADFGGLALCERIKNGILLIYEIIGEKRAIAIVVALNLEDKVLIGDRSIVMNQSQPDRNFDVTKSVIGPIRLIWDPGPISD